MTAFYRSWRGGARKGEAIRDAMREVRQLYPHPFYWASFFIAGKA
jgi:CHAT domain-containing protein